MTRRRCVQILTKIIATGLLFLLVMKLQVEILWLSNDPNVTSKVDYDVSNLEKGDNRPDFGSFSTNVEQTDKGLSNWMMKEEYHSIKIPIVIVLCQKELNSSKKLLSADEDPLEKSKFFRQAKVLLKSITLATENVIRVIIVANTLTPITGIKKYVNTWPISYQGKVLLEYHTFVPRKDCMDKKLFKLCASVRLFLHEILPDEDSVIYVDSDFIFLESPEKLGSHFLKFNPSQVVGAVHNGGFYEIPKYFKNPDYYYYGNTGISSGLLLMNLTRIRKFPVDWTKTVFSVCKSYKRRLVLFDQGVYNIIFSEFTENLYELDCRWSYNLYFCHERSLCYEALEQGKISGVHGPSNTFFLPLSKKLKILFNEFERFRLGDSVSGLISSLELGFQEVERIQPEDSDGCKSFTGLEKALLHHLIQADKV